MKLFNKLNLLLTDSTTWFSKTTTMVCCL